MIPERRTLALCLFAAALALAGCGREERAPVGGPFQLVDQDGQPRTEKVLKGKWSAVFFGFTFCPDVCPVTMQALGETQERLGPKGKDLQVVFISVDPERDKPPQLKSYLSNPAFPKGAIGLTGSPAQVAATAKAYHLYYQKVGDGPDYRVDHTAVVYLMDPKGRYDRVIAYGLTPEEMARQITEAMREG